MRRDLLHYKESFERCDQERDQFRLKIDQLEQRVEELSDLLNMELQKGYASEQDKARMRGDCESQLKQMEREYTLKMGEKERELLMVKSELLRSQESKEDVNVGQKKALIKAETDALEYQQQIKTLTHIIDGFQAQLKEVDLLEERLEAKSQECENLSDDIEALKEQIMLYKYRLIPTKGLTESDQSGSSTCGGVTEQEIIRLAQQNRQLNSDVSALKRRLDDMTFKQQRMQNAYKKGSKDLDFENHELKQSVVSLQRQLSDAQDRIHHLEESLKLNVFIPHQQSQQQTQDNQKQHSRIVELEAYCKELHQQLLKWAQLDASCALHLNRMEGRVGYGGNSSLNNAMISE
ncbi:hypothetical protein FGO68_gene2838 [Halteria grandinella]|uniref:Uncharacterized protein n=1 Tax=Halteria grandinella TaxID=5974 RepID=A0A8J8NZG6_HALGN|nr:hypothetical protein FGO68_gene2838 [Halteria grandinella]